MAESFIQEHTKPRMLVAMSGLGYLGWRFAGPLGAAAGLFVGHLVGKPKS
jgi:hypothetical protein